MNRFFPAKMYIFSKFPYPNDRLRLHPDVHGLHGAHHLHANVRTNILENGVYNYFYLKKSKKLRICCRSTGSTAFALCGAGAAVSAEPEIIKKIKRTYLQCFAAQRKTMKIKTISNSSQAAHWIEFVTLIHQMFRHKKPYKASGRFPGNRSLNSIAQE